MSEQEPPSPSSPSPQTPQTAQAPEGGQQRMRQPEHGGRNRGRRRHTQPQQQQQHQPRRPEASLNMEELRDLVELIAEHGFTDFELEREGFRVRLRRDLAPQIVTTATNVSTTAATPDTHASSVHESRPSGVETQPAPRSKTPHPGAQAEAAAATDEDLHIIKSPIVGTFYRSPSPTADPFVRIGSLVEADTVVCIIEAMKLMNEIQAETSGEVAKIYVENGQAVEYGQPLFGVKR